ncbi:MAG: hypothetical protein AAGF13_09310 [Pseudomonadota bacterium]
MLRGWIKSTAKSTTILHAAALTLLLALGFAVSKAGPIGAGPFTSTAIADEVAGKVFAIEDAQVPARAMIYSDGTVEVMSEKGTWQGVWGRDQDKICLFADGQAETEKDCMHVHRLADGGYAGEDGVRLAALASVLRF